MRFRARLPQDTATLLLSASFVIALVALAVGLARRGRHARDALSVVGRGRACSPSTRRGWSRYLRSDGAREAGPTRSRAPPRLPFAPRRWRCWRSRGARRGVRLGLVRRRARAGDRGARHLAGVRRPGDRRDRRQRGGERGRRRARRQGRVRPRDLGRQELGRADRGVPVPRCWCCCRCSSTDQLTFQLAPVYVGAIVLTAIARVADHRRRRGDDVRGRRADRDVRDARRLRLARLTLSPAAA